MVKLGVFTEGFKTNPDVVSLQTTGGFAIDSPDAQTLSNLQVGKIYERLGYLSQNNIVAVSECIKGTESPDNVVLNMLKDPRFANVSMYGCDKDTGFVIGSSDKSNTSATEILDAADKKTVTSVLNFNGLKIASVHLPGDGPNKKKQTIEQFLDENLSNLKSQNVDVVLGDTNITAGKASNLVNGRKEDIVSFFNKFFGGRCMVLMSNIHVGKHRRGFMLRNQQLKKSVPDSVNDTEADGTIIAIKLKVDCQEMIETCNAVRDQLSDLNDPVVVNALKFRTEPATCLSNGDPVEKVWLDHSVLYVNVEHLCNLTGKAYKPSFPKNLIVVNMGSIVNAGFKNWNTKYLTKQLIINEYDKIVYEIIRKYTPGKLPDYANIFGSEMLKVVPRELITKYGEGVNAVEIDDSNKDMNMEINKAISELMVKLTTGQTGSGLRKRRNSRRRRASKKRQQRSRKLFF